MATLTGSIVDEGTGERIEARVQVLDSTGSFTHPSDAILKVGTGDPFFYSDGSFSVEVPRGKTRIAVERGTEYVPADVTIDAPSRGSRGRRRRPEALVKPLRGRMAPRQHAHPLRRERRSARTTASDSILGSKT